MSGFGVVIPPDPGDANYGEGFPIRQAPARPMTDPGVVTPDKSAESRREALGRRVREVWVAWASEQPDPKPHWLTGWDDLDTGQREVDMRIGGALWGDGFQDGLDSLDYARARGAALRTASETPQAPRPAPGTPQRGSVDGESGEALREVLAERLCPPGHRFGSSGMITAPDGTVRSWSSPLVPCHYHRAQADSLTPLAVAYGDQRAAEALREAANTPAGDVMLQPDGTPWKTTTAVSMTWRKLLITRADEIHRRTT